MDRLTRAAESNAVTLEQFRAKVRGHLAGALAALDRVSAAPSDAFDPEVEPILEEISALEEFLFAFGRDERRVEEIETDRTHRVAAKQREPALETRVMNLDYHVQQLGAALGLGRTGDVYLLPMHVDLFLGAVVRLLDLLPATAFAPDRVIPAGFTSERDSTVGAIVRLMHERKQSTP